MRIELYFIIIIGAFIVDVMNDHKYSKQILSYKKYFKIGIIILGGLFVYFIVKKNPVHLRNIVSSANNCMKYIPIDKDSKDMITPLLDLTGGIGKDASTFMENFEDVMGNATMTPQEKRIRTSGSIPNTKRSVSETKKKYVASMNDWKCTSCNNILPYFFEVDHIVALKDGGSNDVGNLTALCVNCHKKKTMNDYLR